MADKLTLPALPAAPVQVTAAARQPSAPKAKKASAPKPPQTTAAGMASRHKAGAALRAAARAEHEAKRDLTGLDAKKAPTLDLTGPDSSKVSAVGISARQASALATAPLGELVPVLPGPSVKLDRARAAKALGKMGLQQALADATAGDKPAASPVTAAATTPSSDEGNVAMEDLDSDSVVSNLTGLPPYRGGDNVSAFFNYVLGKMMLTMNRWKEQDDKNRNLAGAVQLSAKESDYRLQAVNKYIERIDSMQSLNKAMQDLRFQAKEGPANSLMGVKNNQVPVDDDNNVLAQSVQNHAAAVDQRHRAQIDAFAGHAPGAYMAIDKKIVMPTAAEIQGNKAHQAAQVALGRDIAMNIDAAGKTRVQRKILSPSERAGLTPPQQQAYDTYAKMRLRDGQNWAAALGLYSREIRTLRSAAEKAAANGNPAGANRFTRVANELEADPEHRRCEDTVQQCSKRIGWDDEEYGTVTRQYANLHTELVHTNQEIAQLEAKRQGVTIAAGALDGDAWRLDFLKAKRDDMQNRCDEVGRVLAANTTADNNRFRAHGGLDRAMVDNRHSEYKPFSWKTLGAGSAGRYDVAALKKERQALDASLRREMDDPSGDKNKRLGLKTQKEALDSIIPPHIMGPIKMSEAFAAARRGKTGPIDAAEYARLKEAIDAHVAHETPRILLYEGPMLSHVKAAQADPARRADRDLLAAEMTFWQERFKDPDAKQPLKLAPDPAARSGITVTTARPNVSQVEGMTRGVKAFDMVPTDTSPEQSAAVDFTDDKEAAAFYQGKVDATRTLANSYHNARLDNVRDVQNALHFVQWNSFITPSSEAAERAANGTDSLAGSQMGENMALMQAAARDTMPMVDQISQFINGPKG